jgi:hypothetical protein
MSDIVMQMKVCNISPPREVLLERGSKPISGRGTVCGQAVDALDEELIGDEGEVAAHDEVHDLEGEADDALVRVFCRDGEDCKETLPARANVHRP